MPELRLWKIEMQSRPAPDEEWVTVCNADAIPFRFESPEDARELIVRLNRAQPHLVYRVRPK